MELTKTQQEMLDGKQGEVMAKVAKTLVMYGEAFNAEKMVEVSSDYNHLVTSFGLGVLDPVYELMNTLIDAGVMSKQKFTADPRPLDPNVPANFIQNLIFKKFMYNKQAFYEDQLQKLGLLDKAGYKKKGTYRVQPNGKPLTIRLAAMSGSKVQEPIIQNYIQQWKKMGLNVKLTGGRLMEMNSFYDKVQNDSKDVDMFIGAWSLSSEPSPQDLYGAKTPFNYSRFVTKENTDLLNDIDSQKAFNNSYRVKKFHQWQAYMDKEAYVVPVANSYNIYAINNKLTGYSLEPSKSMGGGFPNWYYVGYAK